MSGDSPQTVTEKAAPHNNIDQDKFSKIIEECPIIWDFSHKDSKNKQLKYAAWHEISKKMGIDGKLIYVVTIFLVSVTCAIVNTAQSC